MGAGAPERLHNLHNKNVDIVIMIPPGKTLIYHNLYLCKLYTVIIYMSYAPRTALYQCGQDVPESGGSLTFDLLKVNANGAALSEGLSNYL